MGPTEIEKKNPTFPKSVLGFKCTPERAAKKATLTNGNDTLGAPSLSTPLNAHRVTGMPPPPLPGDILQRGFLEVRGDKD